MLYIMGILILARYIPILAPLAIAGLLSTKRIAPQSLGTLRVETPVFALMTFSTILIVQLLSFVPVLVLGPIAEQLVGVR
ncbi:MAG: hypothetical protein C4328_09820 [Meiothermus sp.]